MKEGIEHDKNVHIRRVKVKDRQTEHLYLLASDLHWDNPKCKRGKLKEDLQEAIIQGAKILLNGDNFCLMQGKYDPRSNKSNIREEHNHANYLDRVIDTACEWFEPYAKNIEFIGYGNHETSILKRMETDMIKRFADALNTNCGTDIGIGGYGGWYIAQFFKDDKVRKSYKIKYFHGSGGGAPVTKGTIQHNRMKVFVEGADLIWMGHVHNDYEVRYTHEYLDKQNNIKLKDVLMVRTPSYKEEYKKGEKGWHIERGAPPKPIGGRWLKLNVDIVKGVRGFTWST